MRKSSVVAVAGNLRQNMVNRRELCAEFSGWLQAIPAVDGGGNMWERVLGVFKRWCQSMESAKKGRPRRL